MRKFGVLMQNEILKASKKIIILILLIIMTVGMIGCTAFVKLFSTVTESVTSNSLLFDEEYYISNKDRIKQIEEEMKTVEKDSDKYYELEDELYFCKCDDIDYEVFYVLRQKYDVSEYSYKNDILDEISHYEHLLAESESSWYDPAFDENLMTKDEIEGQINKYYDMLDSFTYKDYVDYKKEQIENDPNLSATNKERKLEYYDLLLQICPSGEYESQAAKYTAESLIEEKTKLEQTLESKVDYEKGFNLTADELELVQRDLDIVNKKIECSILDDADGNSEVSLAFTMSFSIGNMFSVIILIILAGSMISHEISTGSIKSLIIAPVKRWKIYLSKYMTVLLVAIALSLYTYVISILLSGILFGFSNFYTDVYYVSGMLVPMNFALSQLIYSLCSIVPLIFFATMAFMLSSITKNTAASVAISMGIYWGGSFVQMILGEILSPYISKFLPFGNIEWFNKIMYTSSNSNINLFGLVERPTDSVSAVFSILYTVILVVCMYWIGRDSFCRKDIKQ